MKSLEYAKRLVEFDSTCFRSNLEVSDYVESVFADLGCETERIEYRDGNGELKVCVLGRRAGQNPDADGGLAWFGHTDVVVSGDWSIAEHGPFEPTVRDGKLYGRGSTDMKGPVACMLAALASVRDQELSRPLTVSCSSDEEIDHRGAIEIRKRSEFYRDLVRSGAVGVIGEPTQLGVVYAHKGGCQVWVTSQGKAAHSSTREGLNANWAMIPFLQEVKQLYEETESDVGWQNEEFDPPTLCMNVGVNDHNPAVNITSPKCIVSVFFRPMPNTDIDELINRINGSALSYGLTTELRAKHLAFRTDPTREYVQRCEQLTGGRSARTVSYGTEACNFTDIEDLVVLGPGDIAQAHKSDEWIELDQLEQGEQIYRRLIDEYCGM
jgi:acetylornithine deacetylase